jgi:fatty acid synthase subunit alpha, fungi type
MAVHTLKAKYETKDDSAGRVRHIFCASKDQKDIYYQFEDEPEAAPEQDTPAEAANPTPVPVIAAPGVNAAPPATAGPLASIEDVPIRTVDILAIIVSQKLKNQLSEIPLFKLIKELSNGKPTLQNEIMGDLQGKFSSAPDKREEVMLEKLGTALESGPQCADTVLLIATTMEPAKRLCLEAKGKAWLDTAARVSA